MLSDIKLNNVTGHISTLRSLDKSLLGLKVFWTELPCYKHLFITMLNGNKKP